jgi:hypothetical protein
VKRPLLAATTLALIFEHPCGVNAQAVQTWQYANINTTAGTGKSRRGGGRRDGFAV